MRFDMDNGEEITRDQIMADFDVLDSERQGRLVEAAERLMAEQQVVRGTVPPIQCPPWCANVTGHAGEFLVEDQIHRSQGHRVELTLVPPVVIDDGIYPQEAWAELWQGLGEETSVDVGLGGIVGIKMTLAEARRLAQHIMVVCDQALAKSPGDVAGDDGGASMLTGDDVSE
jgi:hypothetical protein